MKIHMSSQGIVGRDKRADSVRVTGKPLTLDVGNAAVRLMPAYKDRP
jgi:hypothetical protein